MNGGGRQSQAVRGLFALLVLCALAVRIAIPAGFMPVQSSHGIAISICTGHGAVSAVLPIEKHEDPAGHDQPQNDQCAFAAGLGGGLLAAVATTSDGGIVLADPLVAGRASGILAIQRMAAPPPPSRGPPTRA